MREEVPSLRFSPLPVTDRTLCPAAATPPHPPPSPLLSPPDYPAA